VRAINACRQNHRTHPRHNTLQWSALQCTTARASNWTGGKTIEIVVALHMSRVPTVPSGDWRVIISLNTGGRSFARARRKAVDVAFEVDRKFRTATR